ncbi:TOX high mobility group box family member 4b isoform X1 [Anguilla rostrata]|uniref:TOX high mobility group box family member 4b isoform X1 n=1 Tax=Anguilla rostrata TaxID=7938 RepID=UPI0030CED9E3
MDLNFYSELSDSTEHHSESEFLDSQAFNGYDAVNKFPGGGENFLTIPGPTFLSSSETFHTPSLGDEEFEIPAISLDPDSALSVSDVVSHFGELSDGGPPGAVPESAVVGGNDPSFASTFVSPPTSGLEHLSLGVMNQSAGGPLLSSTLSMDLSHSIGSEFSSSSPMTIDVPLSDINHGLLGHNQLTTIDQSELSDQLGLSLGGGTILPHPQSPEHALSATPSPGGSLQDEDMEDFGQKTALVESPLSLSVSTAMVSLSPALSDFAPAPLRRGGAGKKGRKKKDPNEPQKPVSAYALFFRDTQAAIKGQNPSATFGEVSKIVASMWDSLGEEQKQVYKRKTDTAKKEYLKALAAYRANQLSQVRANQLSQPTIQVMDTPPSPPPIAATPRPARISHHAPEQNTITNICTSNIILDLPQVTTRSRTGAHKASNPAPSPAPNPPTVTKIIISKQVLVGAGGGSRGGARAQSQQVPHTSGLTVIPGPAPGPARQPPPLQQMQNTPLPPRLQQMAHSPAPPPLQAKPRGGAGAGPAVSVTSAPPPPLQIKIVPASLEVDLATPIVVTTVTAASSSPAEPSKVVPTAEEVAETEFTSGEMEVEVNVAPGPEDSAPPGPPARCIRAGCTNAPVESKDWDREYCSNECVATHCRDVFLAWCSIRAQSSATVT